MINAANDIHEAQYNNAWWGKKNPVSVTQASDGTVVVSKNNGIIGPKSRAKATEIFGDDVVIPGGKGTNYNNSINPAEAIKPKHAEARGIQALLSRNIDVAGARQATTLPSCRSCTDLQNALDVNNITGSVK